MKCRHSCHCGLKDQLRKMKAGKLGLLGSVLIVGHLLFHVAECLVIPAILIAANRQDAEAVQEINLLDILEDDNSVTHVQQETLQEDFFQTLREYYPLHPSGCRIW